MTANNGPILYFDGVCNLCNGAVQYVIKHDKASQFRFASLQSRAGKAVQKAYEARYGSVPDSLLLSYEGKLYSKSTAALKTAVIIGKWKWLSKLLLLIPRLIRDGVYRVIAHNRYRWFGKKNECMIPTEELKSRFLF